MTPPARRWVFLADPKDYGWPELIEDGRAVWDGISNARALRNLAETRLGEPVLIYHTAPDKAVVGTARIAAGPKTKGDAVVVEIEAVRPLARKLALAELRDDPLLAQMGFVRMPRVAVHPVTDEEWSRVMELSGTDPGPAEDEDPAVAGGP